MIVSVATQGGIVSPGTSLGMLNVDGDLLLASGVLELEIGGTAPGSYDQLNVGGCLLRSLWWRWV